MNDFTHLETAPQPIKLRIEDYLALESAGAFEGYAKTELLAGELFYMNPQYRPHARLKTRLYDLLRDALGAIGSDLTRLSRSLSGCPITAFPSRTSCLPSSPMAKASFRSKPSQ